MRDQSPRRSVWDQVYGGTQLAVSVLLGLYAGHLLDGRFHTSPWLMLAGGAAGLAAGLYSFLRPYFGDGRPKE